MIYNSLDIIPYKTFLTILQSKVYTLLSSDGKDVFNEDEAKDIWEELYDQYEKHNYDKDANKTLKLSQRIEALLTKYKVVKTSVVCLRFEYNQEVVDILKNYGYSLSEKTYLKDLDRIERESKNYLMQAEKLNEQLPKTDDAEDNKAVVSIDKIILGYCSITGLNFDTNKITVTQFFALQDVVKDKIKSLESNE